MKARTYLFLGAALGILALCGSTFAMELPVPGRYPAIQAAIDAALDGDVVIVADGIYTGAGNKNIDFAGRAITVRSEKGPGSTIIDCENDGRGFCFHSGEDQNTILAGFTIINGYATSGTAESRYGGGFLCIASSPTIINCIIEKNRAYGGGGMCNSKSSAPRVINCVFMENFADEGTGDGDGGGMLNSASSPKVVNCLFIRNIGGTGSPKFGSGGAIRNGDDASPIIANCTFTGNKSCYGGAICNSPGGQPSYVNCIFWANQGRSYWGHEIHNAANAIVTFIHCDIAGGWNGPNVVNRAGAKVIDGGGNINADPLFVDATNPDLYERDYHLSANSPCIDAGIDVGIYADIEGNERPIDFPDVDNNAVLPEFDIGAYEAVPSTQQSTKENHRRVGRFAGPAWLRGAATEVVRAEQMVLHRKPAA